MNKKKSSIKILIDMDNTLNEFTNHFIKFCQNEGWELDIQRGSSDYAIHKYIDGVSESIAKRRMNQIFCKSSFWRTIPLKKDAYEVLRELNQEYDIYIVTALWESYDNCSRDKYVWLMENLHFIDLQKVFFESKKWLLDGDIIIDDKPETLKKFPGQTVAMDYPYNKGVETTYRVNNWKDIYNIFL